MYFSAKLLGFVHFIFLDSLALGKSWGTGIVKCLHGPRAAVRGKRVCSHKEISPIPTKTVVGTKKIRRSTREFLWQSLSLTPLPLFFIQEGWWYKIKYGSCIPVTCCISRKCLYQVSLILGLYRCISYPTAGDYASPLEQLLVLIRCICSFRLCL